MLIAESETGYLYFEGNELTVGSKVNDPPKLRLTSPVYANGGGGGVVSFNRSRNAGVVQTGGQQEEMAMLRVEQAEDVRGSVGNLKAEFNFMVNDGSGAGDSSMRKPFAFVWNFITHNILGLGGGGGGGTGGDTLWAPSGLYFTQQQNDGNLVTYKVPTPYNKASATAVWASSWTGVFYP